jgi:DNA-damage-inducible protein D
MPEDLLTPNKGVPEIEKEVLAKLKAKAKNNQLMLDE